MTRYVCNPIEVDAFKIVSVSELKEDGSRNVALDNGENYIIEAGKMSRMVPAEGDYLVRTHNPDEYEYLNPKHVFEAKYVKKKENLVLTPHGRECIAKVCHETNRAYCQTLGDYSQTSWEDAPDWQKESALKGVEFNIENPNTPASASHDSWLAVKEADGWKYGEVKDAEKKEHPCFVPYEQLPAEQQRKDALFKNIVAALIV